ncbi:MAG: haloalkane dehalogenase [Methanosaeta sp. PtaB.Bin039]|nr:MAG: haloalkane dehalogenase [Methanosaeta sp. PtaB.Bin039]OPY45024.1 MAG: haloalkane dehalogenase [Methanosaeta sp. PtaU1.Bin028]
MRHTLQGVCIEYDDIGDGVPLLLIHGFMLDRTLWQPQIADLSQIYRVITPDLRGFGESSDTDGKAMTMEQYAADLKSLLDSVNLKQAVIGGISMGGYIALAFYAKYADRVKGLILANTRAVPDSDESRQLRLANARKVGDVGPGFLVKTMAPQMLKSPATAEIKIAVCSMMMRQRAAGIMSALRGMALRPDRTALLRNAAVPVLIVSGSQDALISPGESEAMHALIPKSRLEIIPGAGHLSNLDEALEFNRVICEFCTQVA